METPEGYEPSTGDRYAEYILNEWIMVSEKGKDVRRELLAHKNENDSSVDTSYLLDFIMGLSSLWLQLAPKVKGRNDKLEKEFMKYEEYSRNPRSMIEITPKESKSETTIMEALFGMESAIRDVLEQLGITKWGA